MNSILIFILFVAISMIFQAIKQEGSRQKRPAMTQNQSRPTAPPVVVPHRSPGSQNAGRVQSSRVQQDIKDIPKTASDIQSSVDPEGIQTEGPMEDILKQSKKIELEPEKEAGFLDFDIGDLQKSVIMSEILGKPKALRKN